MELIRATERDVDELLAFYQHVADTMEEKGLQQWHWGRYPNEKMIREDITQGDLYYMLEGDTIAAAVVLMIGQEKEYNRLQWSCGVKPGIFHRLAVHPAMQGAGWVAWCWTTCSSCCAAAAATACAATRPKRTATRSACMRSSASVPAAP